MHPERARAAPPLTHTRLARTYFAHCAVLNAAAMLATLRRIESGTLGLRLTSPTAPSSSPSVSVLSAGSVWSAKERQRRAR